MARRKQIDLDSLLDDQGNEVVQGGGPAVGPSDSSDTLADAPGFDPVLGASDRNATGERASLEPDVLPDADIGADRIIEAEDAGLGGGLDQAEEAQLGVTDEEIEAAVREKLGLD